MGEERNTGRMIPITDGLWQLMNEDGKPVWLNVMYPDFRGDLCRITGGHAPRTGPSSGRVYTDDGGVFYPTVFGMKWIKHDPE